MIDTDTMIEDLRDAAVWRPDDTTLARLLEHAADVLSAADTRLTELQKALEEIVALDLARTPTGVDDFYSGPDRFFRAWLIAYKAAVLAAPVSQQKEDKTDE